MKNYKKLYIETFFIIIFCVVAFFVYIKENKKIVENNKIKKEIVSPAKSNIPKPITKNPPLPARPTGGLDQEGARGDNSVTVLAGETNTLLSFTQNTIFYDALVQAKDAGKINFSGKNYPGLGFFVTDIGTLHAGKGKHLLYYINDKEATVGVSDYTLKSGDIIEWKLSQ